MDKPLVIYHGNCADGFTAAWLANIYFYRSHSGSYGLPEDWFVDHHGATYGEAPPDTTGRHVYILDFSYPREVMVQIGAAAASVTHIDHHKTSIDLLDGLAAEMKCPLRSVLDTSRSGAYLTSLFFWPFERPTTMVELVDDRDRWVFQDVRSRPFHASLFSRPYRIGEWNRLSLTVPEAVAEGAAIERKHMKDIAELLDVCTYFELIDLEAVPCANLPYIHASDAGTLLLERFPEARFAATWFVNKDNNRVFSLRSRNGSDDDVAIIAQKFGGGGHKHAAGFRIPMGVSPAII